MVNISEAPLRNSKNNSECKWEPLADFMEENSMLRIVFSVNRSVVVWTTDWRQAGENQPVKL